MERDISKRRYLLNDEYQRQVVERTKHWEKLQPRKSSTTEQTEQSATNEQQSISSPATNKEFTRTVTSNILQQVYEQQRNSVKRAGNWTFVSSPAGGY